MDLKYDTLILSAGGSLGVMYAGSLKVLQDVGILKNIHCFVGCSIGAMVACCLSIGYTAEDLLPYFKTVSLGTLKSRDTTVQTILNCWNLMGMHSTDTTAHLVKARISARFIVYIPPFV